MCDKCDKRRNEEAENTENLYEEFLKQENLEKGNMTGSKYNTGMLSIPDVGLIILQKGTERQLVSNEGVTDLPDTPINSIFVHESEVEEFMANIVYQMGPEFLMKMMRNVIEGSD